ALSKDHRYVLEAHAEVVRIEQDLLSVVVVTGQVEALEIRALYGEDAGLAISERPAREPGHQPGEHDVADAAHEGHSILNAGEAIAIDEVALVLEQRLDHARDVVRVVLAIRVELHGDVRAGSAGRVQPAAHCRAE